MEGEAEGTGAGQTRCGGKAQAVLKGLIKPRPLRSSP